ncbi:AsmA-like C-terminal region-containing protein [Flavobacterium agrisoli]|uniref:AsmA protein n=1 Tax=Flavobacterium agrisoli TaxID=2793066 RepID=A0A934PQ46_9FLAO|nr:AsmA-like C-terminal region-containing protein [Flavobacterium agrisoli]MBK0371033.1 hypothetical protein [Flavobacterium agrisoli]
MNTSKSKSVFLKILKYLGIILVLFFAFLFSAPYIFADKIKEQIKKTANQKLDATLNYKDVSVSFFEHFPSLTLTLSDLKLNGSAPFENENFISSKDVSFGISVPSLFFSKTVQIDEIYLLNAVVNVKVNEKGEANYNIYKSEKKNQKADENDEDNSLKLNRIEIINSKIVYNDLSTKMHLDAFGFDYIGKGDLSNAIFDLHSKAKIQKLNIIYENEPYLMNKKIDADLITKININSLAFLFEQNNLKINQLIVDFKGKFEILKEGYNMDFNVKSNNSDLYDVFTALPPNYIKWLSKTELKGQTDLWLKLKGKYISSQNIAPDFDLDMQVKNGFVNYNKSAFPVSNLNMDFHTQIPSLNPELAVINAKKLDLNIQKNYIKSIFTIKGISNPDINLKLHSKIDLQKLSEALGIPEITLKGNLIADVDANGIYNLEEKKLPITKGTIQLSNGFLKTKYYPNPITDINLNTTIVNQKGTFEDLQVDIHPAELTFEGNPFFIDAALSNFDNLTYDIKAKGILDVAKIYQVFSSEGLDLDGYINADLVLKGNQNDAENGRYSKLYNKGTLELKNIGITSEYLPQKFIIQHGIFKINQDKMRFKNFTASYGKSDFTMNGYMQNVFNYATTKTGVLKGNFILNSNYLYVNEFMSETTITNTSEVSNTNSKDELKTEQIVQTGVVIVPKNLNLNIKALIKKTNFNDLIFNNTNGSIYLNNGKATLQNTTFDIINCKVGINATYEPKNLKTARFGFDLKADEFDIKKAYNEITMFKEMASAAEKAEGIVSLNYQLKGRVNDKMEPVYPSLQGGGILSVKDIKIKGLKMFNAVSSKTNKEGIKNPELSKVDIKSSIKNNIITIERFKFKFAGFRPRIEGTTSLDGRLNIKMRLGLPPLGIIGIPLTVTGTKNNPKVKIGKKTDEIEETEDQEP